MQVFRVNDTQPAANATASSAPAATVDAGAYCVFQPWSRRQCFTTDVVCGEQCAAAQRALARLRAAGGVCGSGGAAAGAAAGARRQGVFDTVFRSGAWMRLSSCDGNLCVGDLRSAFPPDDSPDSGFDRVRSNETKSKWWVFVSDTCTVRLYSRAEAWRVLNGKWLVQWGDSTLNQPAIAMLEYILGVPLFPDLGFMVGISPNKRGGLRRPHLLYRVFDRTASQPNAGAGAFRSTMLWGGCASPKFDACVHGRGMATRHRRQRLLSWRGGANDTSGTSAAASLPAVLVINHFIYRHPQWDEATFMRQLAETVEWLEARVTAFLEEAARGSIADPSRFCDVPAVAAQRPVLLWIGPTRYVYSEAEATSCSSEGTTMFRRRLSWRIDAWFERYRRDNYSQADSASAAPSSDAEEGGEPSASPRATPQPSSSSSPPPPPPPPPPRCRPFRDVVYLARHELTSPLHAGSEYGHHDNHYGATRGMCAMSTVAKRAGDRKYVMRNCLRNATGDYMLLHWWLNVLDGSFPSSG